MLRTIMAAAATALVAASALAQQPIALRDMGSFHVGGRHIEISGQPVKEVVFTPGGVPAKVDPNGTYQVEQMYRVFPGAEPQRQAAAAAVARRGTVAASPTRPSPTASRDG